MSQCLNSVLKQPIYHVRWERELGRVQKAWTNTTIPHSQYFLLLSRFPLFDLLCIYNFQSQPFLFFQLRIYLFFPLPPAPDLICPLFLCLPLFQHNACLWKEVKACFILLPPLLCSLLSVTKELWIPWFGHYFMWRVINETIRAFPHSSLCVLFELNK